MRIGEGLSRAEQETVIRRSADETTWDIYSSDPSVCRKLLKRYVPDDDENNGSRRFTVPKNAISFRSQRVTSESQRKMLSERMAKIKLGLKMPPK